MPSLKVSAPRVLQAGSIRASAPSAPLASAASDRASAESAEVEFVSGLPHAFMELDAQTQLAILEMTDESTEDGAVAAEKSSARASVAAPHALAAVAHSAVASVQTPAAHAAALVDADSVSLADLASASASLITLTQLQRETHRPLKEILRMLAKQK
jgi:hypothetical protein